MSDPDTTDDERPADADPVAESTTGSEPTESERTDDSTTDRLLFYGCAIFGLALATGSVWFFSSRGVWHEAVLRVRPTLTGGGVGAGWEAGVTNAVLTFMIDLIHVADVVLGVFILMLMLIHWTAFHRLAGRMQPPKGTEPQTEAAVADGGEPQGGDRE